MATKKIYEIPEATIWFVPAAATQPEDAIFEVDGLGADAGHQAALYDRGVNARPAIYAWRFFCQFATAPNIDDIIDIYLKTSDGTHPDNDDGTGDIAVSTDQKLLNLKRIGTLRADQAAADIPMVISGVVRVSHRHMAPAAWNRSADALTTDVNENGFNMTPVPPEVQ